MQLFASDTNGGLCPIGQQAFVLRIIVAVITTSLCLLQFSFLFLQIPPFQVRNLLDVSAEL